MHEKRKGISHQVILVCRAEFWTYCAAMYDLVRSGIIMSCGAELTFRSTVRYEGDMENTFILFILFILFYDIIIMIVKCILHNADEICR